MTRLFPLLLLLLASPAHAEGFALKDLTAVAVDLSAFAAGGAPIQRAQPGRLTLACLDCAGAPMMDVLLGRQDDGTEGRVRSGETTMAELEARCRTRQPACRIEALDVAPAVGWLSSWSLGDQEGRTAVILRDGDLLTVRAVARSSEAAQGFVDAALATLVPQIVGD